MLCAKPIYASAMALAFVWVFGCSPAPVVEQAQPGAPDQAASVTQPPSPDGAQDPGAQAPLVSTASAGSANLKFEDETLSFSAVFPDAPANDPVISKLRREAESYLASLKTNARADFDRLKQSGFEARPWDVRVKWTYSAKAGDIVSLIGEASEYTGGAHPNHRFDTHIARSNGDQIAFGDMLVAQRSPSPAMVIAMCEALKAAKITKIKSATILDEPIICVGPGANAKTEDAKLVLAPSNQADRFGGVYVYHEPYAVGAYVEGPYILSVQQEIFAEDLKPEFKALFGGEAPAPN